jgi:Icc-related predicted phosphoesterase
MRVLRRLNSLGIPIITVYGNAETSRRAWWWRIEAPNQPCIEQYGLDRLRNVMLLEFAKARLYDWTIYGFGCRFTSEISGSKRLGPVRVAAIRGRERRALQKFFKTANPTKTIILVHAPPYGVLDVVKEKGSFRHRQHVGDDILRDFIKRRKPAMILCGHLHEWAQKTARIGRTLVVNPGYGHDGEAAIIQLPTLKVNFVKIPGKKAKQ